MNTDHIELDTPAMQPPDALQELGAIPGNAVHLRVDEEVALEPPPMSPPVVSLSAQFPALAPATTLERHPTVISKDWRATGQLESDGEILIEGSFDGQVLLNGAGAITVGEHAVMIGDITGKNVILKGHFKGELDASEGTVAIEGSSRVEGKVIYSNIRMEGGQHSIELVYVPKRAT